jgi:hypothetical protein
LKFKFRQDHKAITLQYGKIQLFPLLLKGKKERVKKLLEKEKRKGLRTGAYPFIKVFFEKYDFEFFCNYSGP